MGLVPFGRLGKPTIDSASIPSIFGEHSRKGLYGHSMQQGASGGVKRGGENSILFALRTAVSEIRPF